MEHILARTEEMVDVVLEVNGKITYNDKIAGANKFFERCFEIAIIVNKDDFQFAQVVDIARTVAENMVRRELHSDFTAPSLEECEALARECIE